MTATTANPLTLARIDAEKQSARDQLKVDAGFAAAGFGLAAAAALFFPPLGLVGIVGAVIGISNTIDAARSGARLASLNKAESELANGKVEDTKKRADNLGRLAKIGRSVGLGLGAAILGAVITTLVAPALLPVAATTALISAIVYPALGVILASRVLEGTSSGAEAVVKAAENPAPPAAAAPEAAAKPSRFASLKKLFTRSAAPANDDTKPAAPAAAPAAPKADAPKP